MLRRRLPDELIDSLTPLLSRVVDDTGLQVEIRDNALTIYHRGKALVRNLRYENGRITGEIHQKYVPLQRPRRSHYLHLVVGQEGVGFETDPPPLALGQFLPEVVAEYKRMMKSVSRNREAEIVGRIVSHPRNRIVDQELMFQEPGVRTAEKIDLCHFDVGLNCLSLAEVKGIHDNRLRSRDGQVPEVIDQLRRYRVRGEQHRSEIIQACETSIGLKRRLGFKSRLEGVPESGPFSLMKKPVLVIGGCSHDDVRAILDRTPEWILLMEGLEEEAAGLILCGQNGCNLNLQAGRQCLVFDPSVF